MTTISTGRKTPVSCGSYDPSALSQENLQRKLLLAFLVWLCSLIALPAAASAFKLKTHVIIADQSAAGISAAAAINVPGIGAVRLRNSEVVDAIRQFPEYYRAGTLGPDVYPDLVGGQLWVHVNKGNERVEACGPTTECVANGVPFEERKFAKWRSIDNGMYLLMRANQYYPAPATAQQRALRLQAIAFAYGYLTHMIADAFAHSYVNEWVRAVFDYKTGNPGALYGTPTEELQHMAIEAYIDAHMPAVSDSKLTIRTPVEFLNRVLQDKIPEPGGSSTKPGAFGGVYFEKLLELRSLLHRLSDRNQWLEGTWADNTIIDAASNIHATAATLASFGTEIGDPITDVEDYFKRRREMVDVVLRKWVVLSGCVGQNILLGSNRPPHQPLDNDACAFEDDGATRRNFEDTALLQDIFRGQLNAAALFGAGISGFDFGRFESNVRKQEQFLRTVLDRGLIFKPLEDIRSLRKLREQVDRCDQSLANFPTCDAACSTANQVCQQTIELAGCSGCPKVGNRYDCGSVFGNADAKWRAARCAAPGFHHCLAMCAGQLLQVLTVPGCNAAVTGAASVCTFCGTNPICTHVQTLVDVHEAFENLLVSVVQQVIEPVVAQAKQKILETYAGPDVQGYIATGKELERRRPRATASWFVNIAFLKEDLSRDPQYLNFIFEQILQVNGQFVNNALSVTAAIQDTFNRTRSIADSILATYIDVQAGVLHADIWRGMVDLLYRIAKEPNFNAFQKLEGSAFNWLDGFRLRNDPATYGTRVGKFVALMGATNSVLSVRGPTARMLRASMHLSADVTDTGAGSLNVDQFHPVTNTIRLTTLGFLGRDGIAELGAVAGLRDIGPLQPFGFNDRLFQPGGGHRVSRICEEYPHIICDAIPSLDDPNHYSSSTQPIPPSTVVGAATDVDVNRSIAAWGSRSSAVAQARQCQLGLTNFLLAANDDVFTKIYRKVFLLPDHCNKPDLIIASANYSPAPYAVVNQDVRFDVTIANIGGAPAPTSTVKITIPWRGATPEVVNLPPMPAGESITVSRTARFASAQTYRNLYEIDAVQAVSELSNANNLKILDYQVYAAQDILPDLVVESVKRQGVLSTSRFTVRVRNVGLTSSSPTSLSAVVAGVDAATVAPRPISVPVPALAANQPFELTLSYTVPTRGTYRARFEIDAGRTVQERDETNNVRTAEFGVGVRPTPIPRPPSR